MEKRICRLISFITALLLAAAGPAAAQERPVTIMAAVSLTDAMRELGTAWAARGHPAPRFSFGASSALARQIEQGAPADIFASADEPWADYLQQRGLLAPGTRTSPIGNVLVLIAPAGQDAPVAIGPGMDLATRLGPGGRLAIADPASVPAGQYAQAALTTFGVWDQVAPRLARTENVRAALLLVERGEVPLGIVYATDAAAAAAAASASVRVVGTFPAGSHPVITYPFALTKQGDTPQARALLAYLAGPEAAPVYRRLGFVIRQ